MTDLRPAESRLRSWTPMVWLLVALVLLCTLWVYAPGSSGPALLDDRSSVTKIPDLKAQPELAWDYIFGDTSGLFGRSVSMSTFVAEKLYLDQGIAGSKNVNIVLHLCNGALVMWLLALLLQYRSFPGYRGLAILGGAVWLLHPLLVSSVLYVVQRMAMLATFFMLLSMIAYIYWRLRLGSGRRNTLYFLAVPVLIALGMLSKENTVVVVPVLLTMEVLWFACADQQGRTILWLRRVSYTLIALGTLGLAIALIVSWQHLAADFGNRPFTLEERLFSQLRILWDYVAQWFWPSVSRMGLYHDDYVWSQGWLQPLTTLYAGLAWLGLLLLAGVLLLKDWGRWLVFGAAWFLLAHAVESSVLDLELYFEHRNYFPAIGLVLMVLVPLGMMFRAWPETAAPLLTLSVVVLVVLAGLSSSQVRIWSNYPLLIMSHLNGHPTSPRANVDMAVELARRGDLGGALFYSERTYAFSHGERRGDLQVRNLALGCMVGVSLPDSAIDELGQGSPKRPLSSVTTLLTLVRQVQDDKCPGLDRIRFADRLAELYLVPEFSKRASANIYSTLAVLENSLGRYDKAYAYSEQFLAKSRNNTRGQLMKLHFAALLGKTDEVESLTAQLQDKAASGQLSEAQRRTLALYLEN